MGEYEPLGYTFDWDEKSDDWLAGGSQGSESDGSGLERDGSDGRERHGRLWGGSDVLSCIGGRNLGNGLPGCCESGGNFWA